MTGEHFAGGGELLIQFDEITVAFGIIVIGIDYDFADEGFEAVIRIGPLADSTLIGRKLKPYQLIARASPGYLAEYGTPAQPEDLLDHECLGYTYWSRISEQEWIFTKEGRQLAAKVNSRLQSNNATALQSAALSGGGIILGQKWYSEPTSPPAC
ncbi:LysR substrate-binding domain-containing protein [Serratia silvae]|uniref:LysR substrate-binding domain-containing protein n=1 Tax=Serratia silvae TaxID=2824122 RepID=UPI0039F07F94